MASPSGSADVRKTSTKGTPITPEERKVIFASSLGTVFEWYDFYLYGSLASIIAKQFFIGDPTTTFIFALLAFAAGFIVRPFGALAFQDLARPVRAVDTMTASFMLCLLVGMLYGQ